MIGRVIPVLSLSVFASMLGAGIIAPMLPLYAESMGVTGLWLGIIFGSFSVSRAIFTPSESTKMRQFANQGTMLRHLRYQLKMTHVLDVAFFEEVSSGRMMAIKADRVDTATVWATLEAAAKRSAFAKIIVAVDRDVNVHDLGSVCLALGMRTQPHRDWRIEKFPTATLSDYSLEPLDRLAERSLEDPHRPEASRILVDATLKWPFPPTSLPRLEYMERARRIWAELGLPPLKLTAPWSGENLGVWSNEHERHAQAAVSGDHYRAGADYARKRRAV